MPTNAGDKIRHEYVEMLNYEDTGCELSSKCMECPLIRCKHDDSNWYRKYQKLAKQRNLFKDLKKPLLSYESLAKKHNCKTDTVKRLHAELLKDNIDLETVEVIYINTKRG